MNAKNSPNNFEKLVKTPNLAVFPIFFRMAVLELLKIASNVDFRLPVHLACSDATTHFVETYFQNSCGVRGSSGYINVKLPWAQVPLDLL